MNLLPNPFFRNVLLLFLPLFFLTGIMEVDAQNRRPNQTDEYFDDGGMGPHRFWYGGGLGLGFSGGGFSSRFDLSISPMLGYKITPEFSVGPRVELSYTHYRENIGGGDVFRTNLFSYGIGAFGRYKIFRQFFLHTEYQIESRQFPVNILGDKERQQFNNFFVGAGYTSGGLIGYEISLLYNITEDDNTIDLPLDYRLAFTYNF